MLPAMQASSRVAQIERGFGVAALFVGRAVTRAASVLPGIVRRASGLESPSPEAVAAGVVRGVTALAPTTFGAAGRPVELIGAASVLALATWTVRSESDATTYAAMLADAIDEVERRGLCGARTAALWRTAAGAGPDAREVVRLQIEQLVNKAPWSLSRKALSLAVGYSKPLRPLDTGLAFVGAWKAMGDAARLVDATRDIALERAATQQPVIAFLAPPSRAVA